MSTETPSGNSSYFCGVQCVVMEVVHVPGSQPFLLFFVVFFVVLLPETRRRRFVGERIVTVETAPLGEGVKPTKVWSLRAVVAVAYDAVLSASDRNLRCAFLVAVPCILPYTEPLPCRQTQLLEKRM